MFCYSMMINKITMSSRTRNSKRAVKACSRQNYNIIQNKKTTKGDEREINKDLSPGLRR